MEKKQMKMKTQNKYKYLQLMHQFSNCSCRLITLLEAKEDMPGVLRKHNKVNTSKDKPPGIEFSTSNLQVLGKLSLLSVARLGKELEGKQEFGIVRREG